MPFTDHKITRFTHRIADLPDQPTLAPQELKQRFDSAPEELRTALNGVCDDAERLDSRVSGIVERTFGDAIPKSMLAEELQSEIDAKMAAADLYYGFYIGDGVYPREINVGFQPRVVFVIRSSCIPSSAGYPYFAIAFPETNETTDDSVYCRITENGFTLTLGTAGHSRLNYLNEAYSYLAIK